jgi:naphthalene 1,2-dioxygenase ferredoxin reductase component
MAEPTTNPNESRPRFIVSLPQALRVIEVESGQTILSAALVSGVDYPHGCRSGRCGSCKSRLAEGSVTMLPHTRFALSEEEKAAGLILACRAIPQSDATVMWGPRR